MKSDLNYNINYNNNYNYNSDYNYNFHYILLYAQAGKKPVLSLSICLSFSVSWPVTEKQILRGHETTWRRKTTQHVCVREREREKEIKASYYNDIYYFVTRWNRSRLRERPRFPRFLCSNFCSPGIQFHRHFMCSFFLPTKVFCVAFLYLHVMFVIFWQKEMGKKAACKMLVKLTTPANFPMSSFCS